VLKRHSKVLNTLEEVVINSWNKITFLPTL
jgi:hypothetical protein